MNNPVWNDTPSALRQGDAKRATRQMILSAAGELFAQHGYDRTTSKDICAKANTNIAAVNYHFGGIQNLYRMVLLEAQTRVMAVEGASSIAASAQSATDKLRALIELMVAAVAGIGANAWELRLLSRELIMPTDAMAEIRKAGPPPNALAMESIIAAIMGLPPEHVAVRQALLSVMAPCVMMLIGPPDALDWICPSFRTDPEAPKALAKALATFSLAGIKQIVRQMKASAGGP